MTDMPDCVVCGANLHRNWFWSDYHGEAICASCGMTYDMAGYRGNTETKCRLKPEYLPIYKEYWEETKRAVSIGFFMGQTEVQRDLVIAFNTWIEEKHPELLTEEET